MTPLTRLHRASEHQPEAHPGRGCFVRQGLRPWTRPTLRVGCGQRRPLNQRQGETSLSPWTPIEQVGATSYAPSCTNPVDEPCAGSMRAKGSDPWKTAKPPAWNGGSRERERAW